MRVKTQPDGVNTPGLILGLLRRMSGSHRTSLSVTVIVISSKLVSSIWDDYLVVVGSDFGAIYLMLHYLCASFVRSMELL